jgi:hypothetical protein
VVFGRREPREAAFDDLDGLLSGIERKTGWQLAERAGAPRPWRIQNVLGRDGIVTETTCWVTLIIMPISYARHRFPPVVIQHAVWLYLRVHLELSRHRGSTGRARAGHLIRDGSSLGRQIWSIVLAGASMPSAAPDWPLAHGRNSRDDGAGANLPPRSEEYLQHELQGVDTKARGWRIPGAGRWLECLTI